MDMLTVKDVNKSFGSKKVLEGLTFNIPKNSIFGFVGQNGAGKTTTMKIILGLLKADSGEIFVNGEKVIYGNTPTNRMIGYLPDVPEFYSYMTPYEYLMFCGEITGLSEKECKSRTEELLERVGLIDEKHRIKGFSRGMKQRLGIAQALIGKPQFLICDEPTSALDPLGRKEILDILLASKEETTILFSTHILSDVERICDHIVFLNQGKLALSGSISEIRKMKTTEGVEVVLKNPDDIKTIKTGLCLATDNSNYTFNQIDDYTVKIQGKEENLINRIMQIVLNSNITLEKLERCENTLEDLFMEVIENENSHSI